MSEDYKKELEELQSKLADFESFIEDVAYGAIFNDFSCCPNKCLKFALQKLKDFKLIK